MKGVRKYFLLAGIILFVISNGFSQVQQSRKYRVTGHSLSNLSVVSVSNEAEIVPAMTIYVPSAFTPNGDGLNDTFGISGEAIKNFNLVIYNKWGKKIFETSNLNEQWDGTYNGIKAADDAYVYYVKVQGLSGIIESK